jgi:hypothetical protein
VISKRQSGAKRAEGVSLGLLAKEYNMSRSAVQWAVQKEGGQVDEIVTLQRTPLVALHMFHLYREIRNLK